MTTRDAPVGRYLAHEVGQLAGVSGTTIGQWARHGYIRASQSEHAPYAYSHQDIAEAIVVHELLERHVSHRAIRAAITRLRAELAVDWPLTSAPLRVATDHRVHTRDGRRKQQVISDGLDLSTGHPVLEDVDLDAVRADLRRGGWPAREHDLQHISVDPTVLSGRPAIAGTRIFAADAGRLAASPAGREILVEDYELGDAQIRDAGLWWSAVQALDLAA